MDDDSSDNEDAAERVAPNFSAELFLEWRSPRFGKANPEQMDNAVWEWLVRTKKHAYSANEMFHGPDSLKAGPAWCFARYGQSSTVLPDGRVVMIGGEHEDYYDADFYIYNDVVVRNRDGKINIFVYPKEIFPPTDFHSATLVGDQIILIGSLGYQKSRNYGTTQILTLDTKTFAIMPLTASGDSPGWIHRHTATLSDDGSSIILQGGKLDCGTSKTSLLENVDDWRLRLKDWSWERLTHRELQQWEVFRTDRKSNHLWQIKHALWNREMGWMEEFKEALEQLKEHYGSMPRLDLITTLYTPPIPHRALPEMENETDVHRIAVDGTTVRYVEEIHSIRVIVEGPMQQQLIDSLVSDLVEKLAGLENTPYQASKL